MKYRSFFQIYFKVKKFGANENLNNLYSMIKLTYDGKVPITSQDTVCYETRASLILLGNYEQLSNQQAYRKLIIKKYEQKSNSGSGF